ncbi:hypothetical protein [Desulfogranum mediterraneum]|uniref:hypothetical protein n=1 Tax=Desulfogranum mediterraneum TaxID=160661 RepID=UPI0012946E6B|nr:hypothetical protein [Desulfogranum mediterraneum]
MTKYVYVGLLTGFALATFIGCARQETPVSTFFGTSYELATKAQLHNPNAGLNSGVPLGLTGTVADSTIKRYQNSFKTAPAETKTYSVVFEGMQKK